MAKRRQGLSPQKATREAQRRQRKFEKRRGGRDKPSVDYQRRELALLALGYTSYKAYLASPLWSSIRARVMARDGHRCQLCPSPAASVHHNSYSPETLRGEDLSPLAAICRPCHEAVEFTDKGTKRKGDQVAKEFMRRLRLARAIAS